MIGLLFDAAGQPLSPSFAYGRKGRLYRYYIGMELQVGADPNGEEGMIRRISAPAVERFLVDTLARLSGRNDIEISDIKTSVRRVELRLAETHMVIALDGLFPGEHPDLALTTVQKRLHAGEQVVMERAGPPTLRVVLPQRLKLRGGRTVLVGGSEALVTKINVGLVNALKRAHADLTALRASPFTDPAELVMASAAGTQHDRHICRLAFMAPELQRRILGGTQPVDLGLRQVLKSPMPLAWADQKLWFETFARA